MKPTLRLAPVLLCAGLAFALLPGAASARGPGDGFRGGADHDGGFRGGAFRGDGFRGGSRFHVEYHGRYHPAPYRPFFYGAALGWYGSLYYPWYAPAYTPYDGYYYPPAVVTVPSEPPTYIEQGQPPEQADGSPPADGYWYWCPDSRAYYPYVKECKSPWRPVVPQAPRGATPSPGSSAQPVPRQ